MDRTGLDNTDEIRRIAGMPDILLLLIGFCIGVQALQHNGDIFG